MSVRQRFSEAWRRFLHDETGAICVGCGLEAVDGVLQVDLDPAGGITCGGSGLAVTFPAAYSPSASPDACNGFQVRGNGLYAPCPDAIVGVSNAGGGLIGQPYVMSTGGDATFDLQGDPVTITNTTCCEVAGRISVQAGGPRLLAHDGFYCEAHLQVNIGGGGFNDATPDATIVFENQQGTDIHTALNGMHEENYLAIPAGGSVTYQGRIHVVVFAGSADVTGTLGVEINWVLPQVGCC